MFLPNLWESDMYNSTRSNGSHWCQTRTYYARYGSSLLPKFIVNLSPTPYHFQVSSKNKGPGRENLKSLKMERVRRMGWHQENSRVVFERLWGLWKDLKTSKTKRPRVFRETGTFSFRDLVIFERLQRIFQRWSCIFVKTVFGFTWHLYKSLIHAYHTADAQKSIIFWYCENNR